MNLKNFIYLLIASYSACLLRFYIDNNLIISFIGSFLFGCVIAKRLSNSVNRILLSGFCSCFTSFSGFIYVLYKLNYQGDFIKLFFYLNLTILLNLILMYFGFFISRKIA